MTSKEVQPRKIATGFLSLSMAKIIFMISGFTIYFTLPRLLSPAEFGNYGVVIGFLSVFNMMLVVGTIQAVSKFVSEKPSLEPAVRSAAFRIQIFIGGGTSLMLILGAGMFSKWLFQDPSLAMLIRIGAVVPCLYSFYSVVMGSFNGRGLYHQQATLDITFAVIKTGLIIAGGWLTGSVFGAIAGFSVTSVLIMVIGFSYSKRQAKRDRPECVQSARTEEFPVRRLLHFQLSVMILTLLSNLLINMDLFMVKALTPVAVSSELAGYYTAAQTFARIPYVLVVALALVMFPLISSSTFARDLEQSRRYIRGAFRFPLVIIAPIAIFISVYAPDCLAVVYPEPYGLAAPALMVLALAELLLAMFYLATAVINGSGKPGISVIATVVSIGLHVGACRVLIPRYGLEGAAWGSVIGWTVGFLFCGGYLLKRFGTLVKPWTVVRTVPAMVVTWVAASSLPFSGFSGIIPGFLVTIGIYWGVLLLIRELSWTELRSVISRFK